MAGPSASIDWVALVWTLTVAVGYTLVGRLSDIFGRRYFFIGGAVLGLIGSIIAATAQSVNSLIGATVLLGLAASTQISFTYVTGELVLVKHRFIVNGLINLCNAPIGAFGPLIARAFIVYTDAAWRWNYYLTIMLSKNLARISYRSNTDQTLRRSVSDHVGLLLLSTNFRYPAPCALQVGRNQEHRLRWCHTLHRRPSIVPHGSFVGWWTVCLGLFPHYRNSCCWLCDAGCFHPIRYVQN